MREIFRPRASIADGQRSADAANSAVEREFSKRTGNPATSFLVSPAIGSNNAERHRQLETRSFLLNVGRGEIDGDVSGRDVVAAVLERGANAVAAFAHGCIGKADVVWKWS